MMKQTCSTNRQALEEEYNPLLLACIEPSYNERLPRMLQFLYSSKTKSFADQVIRVSWFDRAGGSCHERQSPFHKRSFLTCLSRHVSLLQYLKSSSSNIAAHQTCSSSWRMCDYRRKDLTGCKFASATIAVTAISVKELSSGSFKG